MKPLAHRCITISNERKSLSFSALHGTMTQRIGSSTTPCILGSDYLIHIHGSLPPETYLPRQGCCAFAHYQVHFDGHSLACDSQPRAVGRKGTLLFFAGFS
ncbi:hypothetical protein N7G274_002234 [Stereocaulon virgatum]|uniref:Uncharacterized protein n=1 Tax=Stereocaulon virgatum TaxID=373712 RepID=A0ABR4AJ96_9LECA